MFQTTIFLSILQYFIVNEFNTIVNRAHTEGNHKHDGGNFSWPKWGSNLASKLSAQLFPGLTVYDEHQWKDKQVYEKENSSIPTK